MNATRALTSGLAGLLALCVLSTAAAQDAGIDDLEPGVDTSAPEAEPDERARADGEEADEDAPAAEEVTRTESGGRVMDRMELGRTQITGNQELPKVLYIVPWQKAEHGDLSGRPINTLIDEVLAPVDREEFIRTVDYYDELYGKSGKAAE